MQRIINRPAITHNISVSPEFDPHIFDRTKFQEPERPHVETAETEFRLLGSYREITQLHSLSGAQVDVAIKFKQRVEQQLSEEQFLKAQVRAISEKLCEDHPTITTDCQVLGGAPRIKGTRLSVGQILGRIYTLGSIQAVVEYYSPRITEEQVKDAIAYAQDFVETACEPLQANG